MTIQKIFDQIFQECKAAQVYKHAGRVYIMARTCILDLDVENTPEYKDLEEDTPVGYKDTDMDAMHVRIGTRQLPQNIFSSDSIDIELTQDVWEGGGLIITELGKAAQKLYTYTKDTPNLYTINNSFEIPEQCKSFQDTTICADLCALPDMPIAWADIQGLRAIYRKMQAKRGYAIQLTDGSSSMYIALMLNPGESVKGINLKLNSTEYTGTGWDSKRGTFKRYKEKKKMDLARPNVETSNNIPAVETVTIIVPDTNASDTVQSMSEPVTDTGALEVQETSTVEADIESCDMEVLQDSAEVATVPECDIAQEVQQSSDQPAGEGNKRAHASRKPKPAGSGINYNKFIQDLKCSIDISTLTVEDVVTEDRALRALIQAASARLANLSIAKMFELAKKAAKYDDIQSILDGR